MSRPRKGVVTVYDNDSEDTGVINNIALDADSLVTKYDKENPTTPT